MLVAQACAYGVLDKHQPWMELMRQNHMFGRISVSIVPHSLTRVWNEDEFLIPSGPNQLEFVPPSVLNSQVITLRTRQAISISCLK